MKRLFLLMAVATTMALMSCGETCTTCTFTFEAQGQSITQPADEFCGSKSEVNEYKEILEDEAAAATSPVTGTNVSVNCVDD